MTQVLNEAGIHNYTIWNIGDELFGYYECDSIAHAAKVQSESEVVSRWNEYMKDVMTMITGSGTDSKQMKQVFFHG
jgi:L-rhamnose mutarotase